MARKTRTSKDWWDMNRLVEDELIHTHTTLTELRKTIPRLVKPFGKVEEFPANEVEQVADDYEIEFEVGEECILSIYYAKCRTRGKIVITEVGVCY